MLLNFVTSKPVLAESAPPDAPSGPFTLLPVGDKALGWINLLFHGNATSDGATPYAKSLVLLAEGLRHGLGLYNVAMLAIGALLLFYHVAAMVAETAHQGVVFGRRANKVWTPIRLILAIGLLVPVSGGLSAGQYMVVKIAEIGSTLASNAWETVVADTHDTLASLVPPRPPNVVALVATSVEMELCRAIYRTNYNTTLAQPNIDSSFQLMGPITDIVRYPAGRLSPELWRYSNTLNATEPLCGEYHFAGFRPYDMVTVAGDGADTIDHAAADLQTFAHTQTNELITYATALAGRNAAAFTGTTSNANVDMRADLAALTTDIQTHLDAQLKLSGVLSAAVAGQVIDQSVAGGWLSAAGLVPELMRLQESYGELVSHALPEAIEPVFDHPLPTRYILQDVLENQMLPGTTTNGGQTSMFGFYMQLSRIMTPIRQWIADSEVPRGSLIPASGLDLRDHLTAATDSSAAFGMFAAAIDTKAVSDGVWGGNAQTQDQGNPFAASASFAAANPFTALAEYGRRQYQLGTYLLGLSGSAITIPGAVAPAALSGIAALVILGGGLSLIFVIPFLPFFRFMVGALIWLLNLFEAVVAMPIVALAHITPHGDGLSGNAARQAYSLWLALMIRPLLSLAGLVVGYVLLSVGLNFFITALASFAHGSAVTNSGLLIVANMAFVIVFDVFAYAVTNAAFKGIYWLPDQALRWISPFVSTEAAAETVPVIASLGGMPSVTANASVTNMIATQSGGVSISADSTTSITGGSKTATQNNTLKAALFPIYADRGMDAPSLPSVQVPPVNVTTPSLTVHLTGGDKNKKPEEKTKPAPSQDDKKLVKSDQYQAESKPQGSNPNPKE